MKDEIRTRDQLIAETNQLRERLAELQATEAQRKQAEEELRGALEKLTRFEDIINRSPAVVFVWRVVPGDWPVEFVSDNVEQVLGYTAHDLMSGRVSWPGITHPEDVPRLETEVAEYLRNGKMEWSQEYRLITESGEVRWFRDQNLALPAPDGSVTHIQSIVLDVTEPKHIEEKLQREKQRVEEYLDIAGVMLAIVDADENTALINRKGSEILGYEEDELIGKNWFDFVVPQRIRDEVRGVFRELMDGNIEPVEYYENPLLMKGGEERLISFHNTVIRNSAGQILGVLTSGEDITKQKRAEEALRKSEDRFRSLVETTSDWIWEVDKDGVYTYSSPKVTEILGYASEEVIGKTPFDFMAPQEAKHIAEAFQAIMESRKPFENLENTNVAKDGRLVVLETSGEPVFDASGHFLGYRGIDRDVTERKQAEDALRESEKNYRNLVENQGEGIGIVDPEERFIFANPAAHDIFGVEQGGLAARSLREFLGKEEFEKVLAQTEMRKKGEGSKYEIEITRSDGQRRSLLITARPQFDDAGQFTGTFAVFRDITERRKAEEELREYRFHLEELVVRRTAELAQSHKQLRNLAAHVQAAREEERTRVAREVHDELGQMLTALKIDFSWLRKRISEIEHEDLRQALLEKIQLMSGLSDETIRAVRRISAALRPPVLDHFGLLAAIEWHAEEFQERTGIACTVTSTEQRIEVDKTTSTTLFRICQEALTNVVRHADATKVAVSINKKDGIHTLTVKDNGRGITESESHSSESLGILGMRERALRVGGKFRVRGRPNKGTTMTVSIPIAELRER